MTEQELAAKRIAAQNAFEAVTKLLQSVVTAVGIQASQLNQVIKIVAERERAVEDIFGKLAEILPQLNARIHVLETIEMQRSGVALARNMLTVSSDSKDSN